MGDPGVYGPKLNKITKHLQYKKFIRETHDEYIHIGNCSLIVTNMCWKALPPP